jgi:hypothetical protein
MIIVNVDGTTPSRTTWGYSLAFEFDKRTQEGKAANTGMHFSKYIRELIGVIDSLRFLMVSLFRPGMVKVTGFFIIATDFPNNYLNSQNL